MKKKYPKPTVIGEIPLIEIDGEVYGIEVSVLSDEEQKEEVANLADKVKSLAERLQDTTGAISDDYWWLW